MKYKTQWILSLAYIHAHEIEFREKRKKSKEKSRRMAMKRRLANLALWTIRQFEFAHRNFFYFYCFSIVLIWAPHRLLYPSDRINEENITMGPKK